MSDPNLLTYAKISGDCYSQRPDIGTPDSAGRAVFYRNTPLGLCVAFLGTSDLMGWVADLDALTTPTLGLGRVHQGFWRTYQGMAVKLVMERPAVITGHSLGGSLALIYASALCLLGKPPKAVYAYEPAKVSVDSIIGGVLKNHGVDVVITVNGDDIVPHLPRVLGDWQHPAPVMVIKKPENTLDPLAQITDHLINSVIKSIENLAA